MKFILSLFLSFFILSCDGPNHAASNRISTAPMSHDPTETIPSTGQQPVNPVNPDNRVQPRTGSAPSNQQLPTGQSNPAGDDSTSKR